LVLRWLRLGCVGVGPVVAGSRWGGRLLLPRIALYLLFARGLGNPRLAVPWSVDPVGGWLAVPLPVGCRVKLPAPQWPIVVLELLVSAFRPVMALAGGGVSA